MEREYLTKEISDGQLEKIVTKGKVVFLRRYPDVSEYVARYRGRYFLLLRWIYAGWWKEGVEVSREDFIREILDNSGSRERAHQILQSFSITLSTDEEDRILGLTEA